MMGRRLERSRNFRGGIGEEKPDDELQPDSHHSSEGGEVKEKSSLRRGVITPHGQGSSKRASDLAKMGRIANGKDWLISFARLDPRSQMLKFFNDLSREGVDSFISTGTDDCRRSLDFPKLLRGFTKSGMFTVWRPTSKDAIRMMITGEGTGKGLDIKGKSALRGPFSGFVPFLQISDNDHKSQVGPISVHKRIRVFYPNEANRDTAYHRLTCMGNAMVDRLSAGTKILPESVRFLMVLLNVHKVNDYAHKQGVYGIDVPEKLLWEGYVMQTDITRPKGSKYDTGRQSMPAFQQMNIDTLRNCDSDDDPCPQHDKDAPRPVLWHGGCDRSGGNNPLCPQGLLMAYEEDGKVSPVVSDFDCFLLGTRGVKYEVPFREKELSMLSWCIEEIDCILSSPQCGVSWTTRWLEVKKKMIDIEDGLKEMPKFGYADPRSYSIIKGAVKRLTGNGAVRHGPECFNYSFPQELDSQFLVISDTFHGVPWKYVTREELIDILCQKIDEGFTFPLNPKWVLCDPGWKRVYDALLASQKSNVQESINIWYPKQIRRRIDEISSKFPQGFGYYSCHNSSLSDSLTHTRAALAEFELTKYKSKKRNLLRATTMDCEENDEVLRRISDLSMSRDSLDYCRNSIS